MVTLDELTKEHQYICDQSRAILRQRGLEYGSDSDTFSTFKKTALMENRRPVDVCYTLACTKISRLGEQINNKDRIVPIDSIYDGINYISYIKPLLVEEWK